MKTNIEFYPHRKDAHRHPKFKTLRTIYGNGVAGWAAEGRFWALNNFIADSENCLLDLSKPRNKGVVADELGMSIVEFDELINRLKSEEVELLIEVAPNVFSTATVLEVLEVTLVDRKKSRDRKSSGGKLKSSDGAFKSSPELNNKLNYKETKLNETKLQETTGDSCSSNFTSPNFDNEEEVISAITDLFAKYADNSEPDFAAEINPVLEAIFDKRESMTPPICYREICDSFMVMKQKKKTNTDFLLGVIKNKLTTRFSRIKELITTKNQEESNKLRTQTALEEYENDLKIRSENNKKVLSYMEFYEKNKRIFTRDEKENLKRYFDFGMVEKIKSIIEPKMEELTI